MSHPMKHHLFKLAAVLMLASCLASCASDPRPTAGDVATAAMKLEILQGIAQRMKDNTQPER
jgi:hypothetical protein